MHLKGKEREFVLGDEHEGNNEDTSYSCVLASSPLGIKKTGGGRVPLLVKSGYFVGDPQGVLFVDDGVPFLLC